MTFSPSALLLSAYMLAQVEVPTLALAWNLPRRDLPRAVRPLVPVIMLLPAWAFLAGRWGGSSQVEVGSYLATFAIVLVLCMLSVVCLHRCGVWNALFCASAGYTIQNLASSISLLLQQAFLATTGDGVAPAASTTVETLTFLVTYLLAYQLFVRPVRRDRLDLVEDRHMFLAFMLCVVAVIGFDVAIKHAFEMGLDLPTCITLRLVHISFCVFLLYFDHKSLSGRRTEAEAAIDRHIIEERDRQYEESRLTMDAVNRRMHDICHTVSSAAVEMGVTGDPRVDALIMQVLDEVRHYDAVVRTGYEPLDTVITERGLLCERDGVTLSPLADGAALSGMPPADVYALVGGLLDAAIAEAAGNRDASRRDIALSVRRRQGMTVVTTEHYACPEVGYELGRDAGLVVRRHDGSMSTSVEDGVRTVTVVLPLQG